MQKILHGDCLEVMKKIGENKIDSVVTDPPYGLEFMGKAWDHGVPGIPYWKEAIRVLKPGGFLLAFGGTRTFHRLAVAIEDAGFEIRDSIAWMYGSGFPKSHDIGKAIDKAAGVEREVVGIGKGKGGENLNQLSRLGKGDSKDAKGSGAFGQGAKQVDIDIPITVPATDDAKKYDGWGTALKPAFEPIIVARKPLSEKTVAANTLKYGTGGINIDESRIGHDLITTHSRGNNTVFPKRPGEDDIEQSGRKKRQDLDLGEPREGRWPANVILDEYTAEKLDEQSGKLTSGKMNQMVKGDKFNVYGQMYDRHVEGYGDSGGASRFFYQAKTSNKERYFWCKDCECVDNNRKSHETHKKELVFHPTQKPIKLIEYLVNLVTPKGGMVLDPFVGSGTTALAAMNKNFNAIGIEQDEIYCRIANHKIRNSGNGPVTLRGS